MKPSFLRNATLPLSLAFSAIAATQAQALISETTGAVNDDFNPPAPGTSLIEGESESNRFIFAFDEQQQLSVFDPFVLDVTNIIPGTRIGRENPGETFNLSPGLLVGGIINSHFLHFDPNQRRSESKVTLGGGITFDEDIIGLIVLSESLDGSDGIVGLSDVIYPTGVIDDTPNGPKNRRGLGFGEVDDDFLPEYVDIVGARTLNVDWTAFKSIDQIRVITSPDPGGIIIEPIPVPEPASLLGLLGFGALGASSQLASRKKQK